MKKNKIRFAISYLKANNFLNHECVCVCVLHSICNEYTKKEKKFYNKLFLNIQFLYSSNSIKCRTSIYTSNISINVLAEYVLRDIKKMLAFKKVYY